MNSRKDLLYEKRQFNIFFFFFHDSDWVGPLSIWVCTTQARPPIDPPHCDTDRCHNAMNAMKYNAMKYNIITMQ